MPLVVQPSFEFRNESLTPCPDLSEPRRSFDVTSRVALLLGAALGYANDPRPARLAGSTYCDTYDRIENLVRDLIGKGKDTRQNSYTYCESTSLAVS
jgi:hypothetical protein